MSEPQMTDTQNRFGYVPNPAATARFNSRLAVEYGAANLFGAAPSFVGDGLTGDLLPYLSLYQADVKNPDGTTWKAKTVEPPYISQTGNNCTSEGTARSVDALQFMAASQNQQVVHRTCIEAMYAFGLSKANMRGDKGCYGSAMADAVKTIGVVDYATVGAPYDEDAARLQKFANNPAAVVSQFGDKAKAFELGETTLITTWDEYCAWIANQGVVIVCSGVGYQSPRDAKGICARRGNWPHEMFMWGVIRSDGVETAVQFQSWGPGCPSGQYQPELCTGTQPFQLPSYAFRVQRADAEAQFAAGDTYGLRGFPGFEKAPLPPQWTNSDLMG